jgi:hypothetical protein
MDLTPRSGSRAGPNDESHVTVIYEEQNHNRRLTLHDCGPVKIIHRAYIVRCAAKVAVEGCMKLTHAENMFMSIQQPKY